MRECEIFHAKVTGIINHLGSLKTDCMCPRCQALYAYLNRELCSLAGTLGMEWPRDAQQLMHSTRPVTGYEELPESVSPANPLYKKVSPDGKS